MSFVLLHAWWNFIVERMVLCEMKWGDDMLHSYFACMHTYMYSTYWNNLWQFFLLFWSPNLHLINSMCCCPDFRIPLSWWFIVNTIHLLLEFVTQLLILCWLCDGFLSTHYHSLFSRISFFIPHPRSLTYFIDNRMTLHSETERDGAGGSGGNNNNDNHNGPLPNSPGQKGCLPYISSWEWSRGRELGGSVGLVLPWCYP